MLFRHWLKFATKISFCGGYAWSWKCMCEHWVRSKIKHKQSFAQSLMLITSSSDPFPNMWMRNRSRLHSYPFRSKNRTNLNPTNFDLTFLSRQVPVELLVSCIGYVWIRFWCYKKIRSKNIFFKIQKIIFGKYCFFKHGNIRSSLKDSQWISIGNPLGKTIFYFEKKNFDRIFL